ncbi:MAG: type II toxin-antitoxin system Phd/YefM family antitoxin [Acidimicrobiales bacterium]
MPEVSATDAARNFSGLLDKVEHNGEKFTVVRRGRAVAEIHPTQTGRGGEVKTMLRRHRRDSTWRSDVAALRALLEVEERD